MRVAAACRQHRSRTHPIGRISAGRAVLYRARRRNRVTRRRGISGDLHDASHVRRTFHRRRYQFTDIGRAGPRPVCAAVQDCAEDRFLWPRVVGDAGALRRRSHYWRQRTLSDAVTRRASSWNRRDHRKDRFRRRMVAVDRSAFRLCVLGRSGGCACSRGRAGSAARERRGCDEA